MKMDFFKATQQNFISVASLPRKPEVEVWVAFFCTDLTELN